MKNLFTLIFTCFALTLFSQETRTLEKQLNISVFYPGVSFELPLGKKATIFAKTGLAVGLSGTNFPDGVNKVFYAILPAANLQGRYYYKGLKSSTKAGTDLFGNSGNYTFIQLKGNLPSIATNLENTVSSRYNVGAGWGFQRVYENKILLSFGIGGGYYSNVNRLGLIGEFTLGFNLSQL